MAGDGVVQLVVTVEHRVDAERMADLLLDGGLAACAQIVGPVTSRYVWDGRVEQAAEYLLLVKTTSARAGAATDAIVAAHPYEVPEVLVTPVVGGNPAYLDWVTSTVGPDEAPAT